MTNAAYPRKAHHAAVAGMASGLGLSRPLRRLVGWTTTALTRTLQRRRLRRLRRMAIRQLEALDDRLLTDIGVLRDQIPELIDLLLSRRKPDCVAESPPRRWATAGIGDQDFRNLGGGANADCRLERQLLSAAPAGLGREVTPR